MKPKINVEFDNPTETYDPGQIVSGRVFIDCEDEDKTHGLEIEILGEAYVQWTERRRGLEEGKGLTDWVQRFSSEKYFGSLIFDGSKGTTLGRGRNTFPFSTKLPSNIPCSFSGPHGSVKYEVKVNIKRSLLSANDRFSKEFQVNSMPCNLNTLSSAANPVYLTKDKTFWCCCCKSGPITLIFEMHRMGYVPGEYLSFKAEVKNSSNSEVSGLKLALWQYATNYAQAHSITSSKEVASVLLTSGLPLLPGASHIWEACLQIPVVPTSKLGGYCKIIDVDYQLMMEVQIGSSSLHLNAPIIIGTIPLNSIPVKNLLPM